MLVAKQFSRIHRLDAPSIGEKSGLALQSHLANYDKASRNIFEQVETGLDHARANAVRVQQQLVSTGAVSPNTNMDQVIDALMTLSMH